MSDPTGLRSVVTTYAEAMRWLGSAAGGLGDPTTEAHVEAARRLTDAPQAALDAALTAVEAAHLALSCVVDAAASLHRELGVALLRMTPPPSLEQGWSWLGEELDALANLALKEG